MKVIRKQYAIEEICKTDKRFVPQDFDYVDILVVKETYFLTVLNGDQSVGFKITV